MPAAGPTIAVFGTLTRDTTVYADGTQSENLGGLVYTLSTLAALFDGTARILPVANVGFDLVDRVRTHLRALRVDTSLLRRVEVPNNHVFLTYRDAETRDEVLRGLVPPLALEHCLEARDADHAIVNMTSGRDIELGTLQAFRRRFRGELQLDVHSLTLGFATGGLRVLQRPEAWPEWVACADWVQMNETEAALLGAGEPPERFAARCLELGPRGVFVTLGARGSVAAWREGSGTRRQSFAAPHRPEPPFPTGCGDVFGATFAHARLRGASVESALRLATGVASTKACHEPETALVRLRQLARTHLEACFPPGGAQSSSPARRRASTE